MIWRHAFFPKQQCAAALSIFPFVILCAQLLPLINRSAYGQQSGSIEGAVVYQKDSKRPWRYARYYLDRKSGGLAEAVVALRLPRSAKRPAAKQKQTVVIDQKNFQFTPETVAIRAGDRVKFLNSDNAVHNVKTSHPRHGFNINLPAGADHLETFPAASGILSPFKMGCVYHSSMRAWVYVFDHPYFGMTDKKGAFQLKDIAPGTYKLELVHPAGGLRWTQRVTIKPGEKLKLKIRLSPDEKVISP